MASSCPFCGGEVRETICTSCGRNPTVIRRVCPECSKMTPSGEAVCCHCGHPFRNDLRWKIPLIIALFVLAFILAILFEVWGA